MKKTFYFRFISAWILVSFLTTGVVPSGAYAQALNLPAPGTMVSLTPAYMPILMKGVRVHPENPLLFDFILDSGKSALKAESPEFKAESQKLIKYFLASLTIKEEDLWVNLSPYEKDRMITDELGKTELGRDMLAQDYILKQLTASLIYPEKDLGKAFWDRVYSKAREQFGNTDIPVDTFNKVWITADKAKVLERNNVAYVVGAHLKVMLDVDYTAAMRADTRSAPTTNNVSAKGVGEDLVSSRDEIARQVIRDVVIPEIEKEVNEGQNFAMLRQMFYSMILASWYKLALKDALLNQVYSNQAKTSGVLSDDPAVKDKIYTQYLEAYKKGVFNYIKEDMDAVSQQPVPRKYFSGGLNLFPKGSETVEYAQAATQEQIANITFSKLWSISVLVTRERTPPSKATETEPTILYDLWGSMEVTPAVDLYKLESWWIEGGEYWKAFVNLKKALDTDAKYTRFDDMGKAENYISGKKFKEAEKILRQVISANPEYSLAYAYLGLALCAQGNTDEAYKNNMKAAELDAINKIEIRKFPQRPLSRAARLERYMQIFRKFFPQRMTYEAFVDRVWDGRIKENPRIKVQTYSANKDKKSIYVGKLNKIGPYLELFIQPEEGDGVKIDSYKIKRITVYPDLAQVKEASDAAEKSLSVEEMISLGQLHERQGDLESAEKYFRDAVKKNGNDARAHAVLGVFLRSVNRLDEAVQELEIAQNLDHQYYPEYFTVDGIQKLIDGYVVDAIEDFEEAVKSDEEMALAYAWWGIALNAAADKKAKREGGQVSGSQRSEALGYIKHALILDPENKEIKRLLALLKPSFLSKVRFARDFTGETMSAEQFKKAILTGKIQPGTRIKIKRVFEEGVSTGITDNVVFGYVETTPHSSTPDIVYNLPLFTGDGKIVSLDKIVEVTVYDASMETITAPEGLENSNQTLTIKSDAAEKISGSMRQTDAEIMAGLEEIMALPDASKEAMEQVLSDFAQGIPPTTNISDVPTDQELEDLVFKVSEFATSNSEFIQALQRVTPEQIEEFVRMDLRFDEDKKPALIQLMLKIRELSSDHVLAAGRMLGENPEVSANFIKTVNQLVYIFEQGKLGGLVKVDKERQRRIHLIKGAFEYVLFFAMALVGEMGAEQLSEVRGNLSRFFMVAISIAWLINKSGMDISNPLGTKSPALIKPVYFNSMLKADMVKMAEDFLKDNRSVRAASENIALLKLKKRLMLWLKNTMFIDKDSRNTAFKGISTYIRVVEVQKGLYKVELDPDAKMDGAQKGMDQAENVKEPEQHRDNAGVTNGGIDLNAKKMDLDVARDGKGVEMTFDPAMVAEFRKGNFTGVEGIILKIVPIENPQALLGL